MALAGCAAPRAPFADTTNAATALRTLEAGNGRFASGHCAHPHADAARRRETARQGQHPYATVVACSDSRVPVEIIFDQGLGDLFVIRIAGNVIATDEAGSIEYAVEHLHAPLIVVLGHEGCGAVTAVVQGAREHGNIPKLIDHIAPAVAAVRARNLGAAEDELVKRAVEENVRHGIEDLLTHSPTVREAVHRGNLQVVGAVYDIDSARVRWLGPHPRQAELLQATPDGE